MQVRREAAAACAAISMMALGTNGAARVRPVQAEVVTPEVTIRVVDFAGLPRFILLAAERQASFILADAGVAVSWLDCAPGVPLAEPCRQHTDATEICLQIVPQRPPAQFAGALGFTPTTRSDIVSAYYGLIDEAATYRSAERAPLLSAVVVHEIGHVFLGARAHSPNGLMRAHWSAAEYALASRGLMLFTPQEADQLRRAVLRRAQARGGDGCFFRSK